ncbi:hypothetical protein FF38_05785 [Lucilia cuprina]|uniref:Uncharacterized protein n=1 Tax=Lucilia cuprina TaxID=7375 RepID=A0A0L0BZY1_LUCCU|nr:hypothetical protein FF38_05785 [Lucilia cuprina]
MYNKNDNIIPYSSIFAKIRLCQLRTHDEVLMVLASPSPYIKERPEYHFIRIRIYSSILVCSVSLKTNILMSVTLYVDINFLNLSMFLFRIILLLRLAYIKKAPAKFKNIYLNETAKNGNEAEISSKKGRSSLNDLNDSTAFKAIKNFGENFFRNFHLTKFLNHHRHHGDGVVIYKIPCRSVCPTITNNQQSTKAMSENSLKVNPRLRQQNYNVIYNPHTCLLLLQIVA